MYYVVFKHFVTQMLSRTSVYEPIRMLYFIINVALVVKSKKKFMK